jgi:hypothetical protein
VERDPEKPPLLLVAEVVLGNTIPFFGVIFLAWRAVTVVTLYVLDGWFCILGLGASVMICNRAELTAMIPKRYGAVRRFFFLVVAIGLVEAMLSMFALVPGFMVIAHMDRAPGAALVQTFGETGALISVAMLVCSHVARIARGVRGEGEGVMGLDPKMQMGFYAGRMALMMALAWLASPGFLSRFLVPVYVGGVGALFTYSDLYPRRFIGKMTRYGEGGPGSGGEGKKASAPPAGKRNSAGSSGAQG